MNAFDFPAVIVDCGFPWFSLTYRQRLDMLEYALWQLPNKKTGDQFQIKHYFSDGIYMRELFIPAGDLIVGKIHKTRHLSIMSKGDKSMMTEFGITRIQSPYVEESMPGMKRAGYAHTDTVWTTIHATCKTDISEIEADLFEDSDISWIDDLHLSEAS